VKKKEKQKQVCLPKGNAKRGGKGPGLSPRIDGDNVQGPILLIVLATERTKGGKKKGQKNRSGLSEIKGEN